MSNTTAATNNAQADILSKFGNIYPESFVNCVREGVTWLANHNNLTYQTSTVIRTDAVIYDKSGSGVLKLGLVDDSKPTTGTTFYDVLSVKEVKDLVNGSTIFTVKTSYKTPTGLELTLIPIKYFNPNKETVVEDKKVNTESYTIKEVDELIKTLAEQLENVKTLVNNNKADINEIKNIKDELKVAGVQTLGNKVSLDVFSLFQDKVNAELVDLKAAVTEANEMEFDTSTLDNEIASIKGRVNEVEALVEEGNYGDELVEKKLAAIEELIKFKEADILAKVEESIRNLVTTEKLESEILKVKANSSVDLSAYLTEAVADAKYARATDIEDFITAADLEPYAKKSELPTIEVSDNGASIDTSIFATKEELNSKANTSDVYSKTEADDKFALSGEGLSDVTGGSSTIDTSVFATKEELNTKANVADVYTKSEVYTKQEADDKFLIKDVTTQE